MDSIGLRYRAWMDRSERSLSLKAVLSQNKELGHAAVDCTAGYRLIVHQSEPDDSAVHSEQQSFAPRVCPIAVEVFVLEQSFAVDLSVRAFDAGEFGKVVQIEL